MDKKIKILHIIKTLGLGGAEVNLLNLLKAFNSNAFELHVAYSYGGELEPKFKEAGIRLCKYAEGDHRVKSLATIGIVARLSAYILQNKIDIIHTHTFSAHIWGSMAAKLTGRRIIEHVHDFRYLEPVDFARRRGFNNQYKFIRYFKNVSDRVVVLTRQNRDFLVTQGIYPSQRIREYQNGIPLSSVPEDKEVTRRSLRKKFDLSDDALVVLTPIRIAPEKNADLIVRTAADVIRRVPNAVFLIAGDGPLAQDIQLEVQRKGLAGHVKFIGYHADIGKLLDASDVFLLPSFLELHSIAILEAMSRAVAVVISKDVGCNSEFIRDWDNGVLLDPFSDAGWGDALAALLQNESLRRKIGEAGLQTCREKFDIKDAAARFEGLYRELIKK